MCPDEVEIVIKSDVASFGEIETTLTEAAENADLATALDAPGVDAFAWGFDIIPQGLLIFTEF